MLRAQDVPAGAEGAPVLSIDLSTAGESRVYDRAPDSAPRHRILANLRTREGRPLSVDDLDKDLKQLTEEEFLFRSAAARVELVDPDGGGRPSVRVRLILTPPLIRRLRVVAFKNAVWGEDALTDFWRSRPRLDSAEGSEFSVARIDADVRALAGSGAFLHVRAEYKYEKSGVDVLLRVIQNQPLAVVKLSGVNQTGYASDLRNVVAGRRTIREIPGDPDVETLNLPRYFPLEAFEGAVVTDASPASISGAASLIEAYYRSNGFAFVSVNPRVIGVPAAFDAAALVADYGALSGDTARVVRGLSGDGYGGRVALVFEIFEGPRVLVGDILFSGLAGTRSPGESDALTANRFGGLFSPIYVLWYGVLSSANTEARAVLRDMIRTSRGGAFVQSDCVRDAELLQSYLQQRGWLDARVSFSNVQWNNARNRVNVVFHVSPGPVYAATDLRVEYQTRAPRVPQGAAPPQFDAPVITWQELATALRFEASELGAAEAVARWGADYARARHDPVQGRHLAAFSLGQAVPWDDFALNGEPGRSIGAAGRLRELLASRGYSNVEIEFIRVETRDERAETDWEGPLPARRVGIILRVEQGYKSYVGNVTFRGNEGTREDVVRREVSLFPGEVYDGNKLRRGADRLRRTQWFDAAAPGPQGVGYRTTPRQVRVGDEIVEFTDIEFELVEGLTNVFNFAAGYNTNTGFTATVDLTLRNFDITSLVNWAWGEYTGFTGAGQRLTLTMQPPLDRQQVYRISFIEPWLFGYPWSGGIAAEYTTNDRGDYTTGRAGIDPWVGWRALPDVTWSFGYSYSIVSLADVSADAALAIRNDEGTDRLSQIWSQIEWVTTDNPIFPTTGFLLSYRLSYTGGPLGGTLDFWRMSARAQYYHSIAYLDPTRPVVLAFSAMGWWQDVHSDTEQIPFVERFLLGGNSISGRGLLRGYRYGGVGPSRGGEAVGGNFMLHGFAELRVPIFTANLWAVGFVDSGILTPTLNTFDGNGFTVSAGFGLRLLLPILPVPFALDFGFPIIDQPGNRQEVISINLGFGF